MSTPRRRGRRLTGIAVGLVLAAGVAAPATLAATSNVPSQPKEDWICVGDRNAGGVCVGNVDDAAVQILASLLGLFSGAGTAQAFTL